MKKIFTVLILCINTLFVFGDETFTLSHEPGTYGNDIYLEIQKESTAADDIRYYFKESLDHTPVSYTIPLELTALQGEEREYTLVLLQGNEEKSRSVYTIDKRKPGIPQASVNPGVYYDDIALTFQYSPGDTLYYSIKTADSTEFKKWNGAPIVLQGKGGYIVSYDIEVYSIDSVGNRSDSGQFTYIVNKNTKADAHFLDVLSPVSGTFHNRQLLACKHSGLSWIRYTLNGSNPVTDGREYTKPILLNRTGPVRLRIAGYAANSKRIIEKEVEFTVREKITDVLSPGSGVITEEKKIRYIGSEHYFFTLDGSSPTQYDEHEFTPITFKPVPNMQHPVVVRFSDPGESAQGEYRYTYLLDGRKPSQPIIVPFIDEDRSSSEIVIVSERGTQVYYTTDGTQPNPNSKKYEGPFTLEASSLNEATSFTIRALAVSNNGIVSDSVRQNITFALQTLPAPEVVQENEITLSIKKPATGRVVYEKSYTPLALQVPDEKSPTAGEKIIYNQPYGMENKAYFQFAVIDSYGNRSIPSDIYELRTDNQPPAKPVVKYLDGIVKISPVGTSKAYYTLEKRGEGKKEKLADDALYEKPFFVFGEDGKKVTYHLSARAVDETGNDSGTTALLTFIVDRRAPSVPVVTGVENGGVYNKPVAIRFSSTYSDQQILYEVIEHDIESEEDDVSHITTESSRARDGMVEISGEEGTEKAYTLYYAPFLEHSGTIGEVASLQFTVDREYPAVPVITGFEHEGVYTESVVLKLQNPDLKGKVYYSLGTGGIAPPDCFGEQGREFTSPLRMEGAAEEEITYSILFGAVDEAGNKTYVDTFHRFTIDRKPPSVPRPKISEQSENDRSIFLDFPESNNTLLYEISEGNIIPPTPTEQSKRYIPGEHIELLGKSGEIKLYHIRVMAVDLGGNKSRTTPIYSITVDRESPSGMHEPIFLSYKSGAMEVSWQYLRDDDVYYSVNNEDWQPYTEPFAVSTKEVETISYYLRDASGNKTETYSIALPAYKKSIEIETFLAGVQDDTRYNGAVTVYPDVAGYDCRYEVSYRQEYIQDISQFSPVIDNELTFDVLSGETRRFFLVCQLFDPETNLPVSEKKQVRFTIDKTKPDVPRFAIDDTRHFQDSVTIPLEYDEGEAFYSITVTDVLGTVMEKRDERLYTEPLQLDVSKGEFARFTIEAYAKDDVGNRSPVVKLENLIVDKKIIYVSRLGNDLYTGSRSKPFQTLGKAVDYAFETGRNILYLSGGSFEIDDTVRIGEDLTIYGGYDPFTWKIDERAETIISAGEYLRNGNALCSVYKGLTVFKRISFVTVQKDPVLLSLDGGELSIYDVKLMNTASDKNPLILQKSGNLTIENSSLQSFSTGCPILLQSENGLLSLKSSLLENKTGHAGTLTLLQSADNSEVTLEKTIFRSGKARETTCLSFENSQVRIMDVNIRLGNDSNRANGIRAINSDIRIENSEFTSFNSSRINTTLSLQSSELEVKESTLLLRGLTGAIGINANESGIRVENCFIKGEKCNEFMYPFQCKSTTVLVFNNYLEIKTEADYIGFDIDGSETRLFNNTFIFRSDSNNSFGVWCRNTRKTYIINNIIMQHDNESNGTALSLENTKEQSVLSNNLSGWEHALRLENEAVTETEELNNIDGNPRGGNFHKNIEESFSNAFLISKDDGPYRLKQSARCVNGGIDTTVFGGSAVDFEGDVRPNPQEGIKPEYDIGADEY